MNSNKNNSPLKVVRSASSQANVEVGASKIETHTHTKSAGDTPVWDYPTRKSKKDDNKSMSDSYSRETIDAKFETLEQKMLTLETKMDGKLDLILQKMDMGFSRIEDRFSHQDTRIEDQWKVTIGILATLVIGLIVLGIQNATQKPSQTIIYPSSSAVIEPLHKGK